MRHPLRVPPPLRALLALGCLFALTPLASCSQDPLEEIRDLHAQGRYEASLPLLQELLDTSGDDPEVHYRYGVALGRTGDPGKAVWSLREAAQHPDWAIVAGLELASGAIRSNNWASALEAADAVLAIDPDSIPGLTLRAEAEIGRKKNPQAAIADLDRVLEQEPQNVRALALRTTALILAGRHQEAEEAVLALEQSGEEALLDKRVLGQLCVTRAVFQAESEKLEDAEASFAECLERYPAHPVVLEQTLEFFEASGYAARARKLLEQAVERQPQAISYRVQLAHRHREVGDLARAEQVLREGLQLENELAVSAVWSALTEHFAAQGDFVAAADSYGEAMALADDPPAIATLEYADLLARAGRHEQAREVAQGLANEHYRELIEARIQLEQGHPKAALAHLDAVLPHWPNNPSARYYAARAAEQLGDFDRAIEEYRQSLRSNAALTEAGLRLAKLHEGLGDVDAAWTAASHHFRAHPEDPDGIEMTIRLAIRRGAQNQLESLMRQLHASRFWAHALAVRVDEVAARRGPRAAIERVRSTRGVDPTKPQNAPLLRALIGNLVAAELHEDAEQATQAALAAAPESAEFLEIRGRALEGRGEIAEARSAFRSALERNPRHALAHSGLGRLAESEGEAASALAHYDRATALRPTRPDAARRAAALAQAMGRREEAARRWREFLREHPWDAKASLALAQLRLEMGQTDEETLETAQRAVLFRGGEPAVELLARIHEARGEDERARELRSARGEAPGNAPADVARAPAN